MIRIHKVKDPLTTIIFRLSTYLHHLQYSENATLSEKYCDLRILLFWNQGWGKTSHPGNAARVLQQSPLRVVSNRVCHQLNKPNTRISITNNMICAGFGPRDIRGGCHGDSGGPFVCREGMRWVLHGAVSWGSGTCSTRQAYTVFAKLVNFRRWIDMYIKY